MQMPNYFSSPKRLLKRVAPPRATGEHGVPQTATKRPKEKEKKKSIS